MQNKSNKEKHLHTFLSKMLSFLKYIKGKVLAGFNFIKKKCETLYDFLAGRVNVDIVRDAKILVFTLLLIVVGVLIIHIINISYNSITNKMFENKKVELSQMEVDKTVIPTLPLEDMDKLSPVSDTSSIYHNQNFYMFELKKPIKSTGENTEDYSVSVYIHKPNNVLEFFMKDWYGNIITDKYLINVSLRESQTEHNLDVLQLNKKDEIERLENYIISDIEFESYKVTSRNVTKYFLLSELSENICLVYSISQNKVADIPNFNYLSHIVPAEYRNLIEQPSK